MKLCLECKEEILRTDPRAKYCSIKCQKRSERKRWKERYKVTHPYHQRARESVRRALLKGILIRLNFCQLCGCFSSTHAHHSDYSKPLQVCWLCKACHDKVHKYIF